MRKIRQSFPKRGEMLATPFLPLADEDFLQLVSDGLAIPGQRGSSFTVGKWRGGTGMDPKAFLVALKGEGLSLEVRRYKTDVNVRVARNKRAGWALTAVPRRGTPP
jgi:hypothetical protein